MYKKFRFLMDQSIDPSDSNAGGNNSEEKNGLFSALFDDNVDSMPTDQEVSSYSKPVSLNDIPLPDPGEDKSKADVTGTEPVGNAEDVQVKKKVSVKLGEKHPAPPAPNPTEDIEVQKTVSDAADPNVTKKNDPEEDPFVGSLLDEEKQRYELAKKAESLSPEFKGLAKKYLEFAKEVDQYTKKRLAEDDEYDFQSDPKFKELASKNPITPQLEKKIDREELKAELLGESRKEIEDLRRQQYIAEQKPQVDQMFEQFKESVVEMLPDYFAKAIETEGLEAAKAKYPLEFDLADQHAAATNAAVKEFLEVSRGLKQYDSGNPLHQAIYGFISKESKLFIETAKSDELVRDGKRFVTREDFARMKPDERSKHWTLTNQQILKMVRIREKEALIKSIEAERERIKRYSSGTHTTSPLKASPSKRADPVPTAGRTVIPSQGELPSGGNELKSPIAKVLFD